MIDQIINHNKTFVAQKGYERYITDKLSKQEIGCAFLHGHKAYRTSSRSIGPKKR